MTDNQNNTKETTTPKESEEINEQETSTPLEEDNIVAMKQENKPSSDQETTPDTTALKAELAEAKDKMLRAMAEMENLRRRTEKEKEDTRLYALSNFAKGLLSVADNFRRALDSIPDELKKEHEPVQNLVTGIEATERELLRCFDKAGIEKIEPMGQMFNPNQHEVMFEMDAAGQQPGTILQVVETGYILNGRLLRPARVGIAKGSGNNEDENRVDTMA